MPVSSFEGEFLLAEVLWQDHFGNLQLNISEDDIKDLATISSSTWEKIFER